MTLRRGPYGGSCGRGFACEAVHGSLDEADALEDGGLAADEDGVGEDEDEEGDTGGGGDPSEDAGKGAEPDGNGDAEGGEKGDPSKAGDPAAAGVEAAGDASKLGEPCGVGVEGDGRAFGRVRGSLGIRRCGHEGVYPWQDFEGDASSLGAAGVLCVEIGRLYK